METMTAQRSVSFTLPQLRYLVTESERLGISFSDLVRRIVDAHRAEASK